MKKLIQFKNIVKEFDGQIVLKGVNLDIYENEFVTLLGPSGCGKTTLLRILGGFLEPTEGKIIFDGQDISQVPPYKREINTVFQKYALFPHMNVYENIAFGLKIKKQSKDVIEQKVMRMLLGPSGCGKTTLLRILGGFLEPTEGKIIFDGQDISQVPPYKREINTVFQKYALFPHMNVYENIAFGLKIKKQSKDVIEQKVMRMLSLVGLEGFEKRNVTLLSGGQQQRVAIARALVNEPEVLLLDEPLGALDLKLRKEMQHELKKIQKEVGITFIFVTHDQEEALTMSDKIVVMKDGEIQQIGTPEEIYNEPENEYVARFIGESNIIDGVMKEDYRVMFDDKIYDCVDFGFKKNENVDIVIRPEDIDIVPRGQGILNGEVKSLLFKGVHYEIMVQTVSGTAKTVKMHVLANHDKVNPEANEKISANDFTMDLEDVAEMTDADVIARANAQAWDEKDEFISWTSALKRMKTSIL